MINQMHGWKVISKNRCSYNLTTIDKQFIVYYPVNQQTFPKIPGSKIFFFDSKQKANLFKLENTMVVPCIAYDVTKPTYVLSNGDILDFWQWKLTHPNRSNMEYDTISRCKNRGCWSIISTALSGTLWANSITCLK